jgi:hypothetical protein
VDDSVRFVLNDGVHDKLYVVGLPAERDSIHPLHIDARKAELLLSGRRKTTVRIDEGPILPPPEIGSSFTADTEATMVAWPYPEGENVRVHLERRGCVPIDTALTLRPGGKDTLLIVMRLPKAEEDELPPPVAPEEHDVEAEEGAVHDFDQVAPPRRYELRLSFENEEEMPVNPDEVRIEGQDINISARDQRLWHLPPGTYKLTVQKAGYVDIAKSVTIGKEDTHEIVVMRRRGSE